MDERVIAYSAEYNMETKTKKPHSFGRRTDQTVTVRLICVEPSENEWAVAERVWAMLLGEPENEARETSVTSLEEKPA